MTQYQSILLALQQQYQINVAEERFGSYKLTTHRIKDPDALLDNDETLQASHDELPWHPYWVHSGAAANAMCEVTAGLDLEDQQVLDLGCGLGITSAVAARGGAFVTACDHAPPALDFARLNTAAFENHVTIQLFDWRTDSLPGKFSLIIGSDILYNRADLPFLLKIFDNNLAPGGLVILGDPARPLTNDLLKQIPPRWQRRRGQFETPDGAARLVMIWGDSLSPQWTEFIEQTQTA